MSARYNPRKDHPIRRRVGFKQVKKTFLIVCEGVNTEPEYFNAFRLTSATVKAIGKGLGTMSLVREAISVREQEKQKGKRFNFCWVVFDKDDYQDFDEAIELAKKNGFEVAYSNQAFELICQSDNLRSAELYAIRPYRRICYSPGDKKTGSGHLCNCLIFNVLFRSGTQD